MAIPYNPYTTVNVTADPWSGPIPPSPGGIGTITAANWSANTIQPKEYAIQGKMYTVNYTVSDVDMMGSPIDPDKIKAKLVSMLVEELWKDKAIEFTKIENTMDGSYKFHARIFATPNTQVKILRENGR